MSVLHLKRDVFIDMLLALICAFLALGLPGWGLRDYMPRALQGIHSLMLYPVAWLAFCGATDGVLGGHMLSRVDNDLTEAPFCERPYRRFVRRIVRVVSPALFASMAILLMGSLFWDQMSAHEQDAHRPLFLIPYSMFMFFAYVFFKEGWDHLQNIHVIEKNEDKTKR